MKFLFLIIVLSICCITKVIAIKNPKENDHDKRICTKEGCFVSRSMRDRVKEDRERDARSESFLRNRKESAIKREMRKARFRKHDYLLKDIEADVRRAKRGVNSQEAIEVPPKDTHPAAIELRKQMDDEMQFMNNNNMSISKEVVEQRRREAVVVLALIKEESRIKREQHYAERKAAAIKKGPPTVKERAELEAKVRHLKKTRDTEALEKSKLDKEMQYYEDLKNRANRKVLPKYTESEREAIRKKMDNDLEKQRQKGTAPSYAYHPGHPNSN